MLSMQGRFSRHEKIFDHQFLIFPYVFALGLALVLNASPAVEAIAYTQSSKILSHKIYEYANGKWFDGQTFQNTTFYTKHGRLTRSRPLVVDEVIDLGGRFVVPPYGEAHTHNVEGPWNIDHTILTYLRHGIFYIKNPNNIREFSENIREKINTPQSIDVVFAHAGLTSGGGHPISLYENVLQLHRYEPIIGKKKRGWFENRGYFTIDSIQDLEQKWPLISAGKPDFLKIYIGNAPPTDSNPDAPQQHFRQGLNPDLVTPLVKRAQQHGLRVTAHVETARDFRKAVASGVEEIAHLPGWHLPSHTQFAEVLLQKQDAQLAADQNVTVVTTTVANQFPPSRHHNAHSPSNAHSSHAHSNQKTEGTHRLRLLAQKAQKKNLQLLHKHGVKIAIGSDHAETSLDEAQNLYELGVFENLTLLKMWCETTAHAIFPHRKIGRLEEGYEANFIVLQGNPILDFQQVRHITFRVKEGVQLLLDRKPIHTPTTPHSHHE